MWFIRISVALALALLLVGCYKYLMADYPDTVSCPDFSPHYGGYKALYGPRGGRRPMEHPGMDLKAPHGTKALAISDGTIVKYNTNKNAGMNLWVVFQPKDTGLSHTIIARYAHLEKAAGLELGSKVRQGQVLGKLVPYPGGYHHLHIEFRKKEGKYIDPVRVFLGNLDTPLELLPSKKVKIPYITDKGVVSPKKSKIIWPLACTARGSFP